LFERRGNDYVVHGGHSLSHFYIGPHNITITSHLQGATTMTTAKLIKREEVLARTLQTSQSTQTSHAQPAASGVAVIRADARQRIAPGAAAKKERQAREAFAALFTQ